MKNHFFMAYPGNKRNEVEGLYNEIKDQLNDIEIIIEPFCGSSVFSYYLSLKHPKKFKYILNDNNKNLIEIYKIMKDENLMNDFINKLNDMMVDINKEKYGVICKIDKVENWFLKNKIYTIRPGVFPLTKININKFNDMKKAPILEFLKNEDITFTNIEGCELIEEYKNNNKVLIFLDPPYLESCNDFYYNSKINIYEYLYKNPIVNMKAIILLCLEDQWIIRLLFEKYIKSSYNKKYELSKKNTTHLIIKN